MATTIDVNTAVLEVTTVKLTRKVLAQVPFTARWDDVREAVTGKLQGASVLGWIHGSAFSSRDDYPQLLISFGNGMYVRYQCSDDTARKFQQIYVV